MDEYIELTRIISDFDSNLLLIKGWGITFSLAALTLGFKEKVRGIFLVAAISALCFWVLEAEMKQFQKNHYLRMNEIEYLCAQNTVKISHCMKIDWSWRVANSKSSFWGESKTAEVQKIKLHGPIFWYFQPHVFLPHLIVVLMGIYFFTKAGFRRWVKPDC